MYLSIKGVDLRITQGRKGPDDLRMDIWNKGKWQPVHMAVPLAMVDFFAENERHLQGLHPNWRQNGDRYFLSKCVEAVRDGWEKVAAEIERHRKNVA